MALSASALPEVEEFLVPDILDREIRQAVEMIKYIVKIEEKLLNQKSEYIEEIAQENKKRNLGTKGKGRKIKKSPWSFGKAYRRMN